MGCAGAPPRAARLPRRRGDASDDPAAAAAARPRRRQRLLVRRLELVARVPAHLGRAAGVAAHPLRRRRQGLAVGAAAASPAQRAAGGPRPRLQDRVARRHRAAGGRRPRARAAVGPVRRGVRVGGGGADARPRRRADRRQRVPPPRAVADPGRPAPLLLLAGDAERTIGAIRYSYVAGYLPAERAWELVAAVGDRVLARYSGWDAYWADAATAIAFRTDSLGAVQHHHRLRAELASSGWPAASVAYPAP
ncbi:DUF1266 domain-containing protein [Rathayibacter oskolensis]|uniref:DUF1266 domain-containing protein n=1 Tax=Rathayibacter oskolensis TaxID=1891671 RepID=UPI00265DAFEA|nr:DUF1266 domain-containing protein [Rathayibacter oskolensis]WKK72683.1 DUF1266 domain-containing protein [Rathayibacter oskolensis]